MDVALGRRLLPLLCGALVAAAGCAHWGSQTKKDDPNGLSGVISPTQQIRDLRDLAKTAPAKSAYEKQLIEQQLAGQIKHEQDPLIRAQIVRTLGEYPSPTSDVILRAAVKDGDNDVRVAACDSWGKRDTVEAATTLAGVLNGDLDHDVRLAAARAMAPLHQQVAINALGDALEDKDPAMQYRAVLSLRQITGQDLGNDVNKWREYARSNRLHPAKPVLAGRADLASVLARLAGEKGDSPHLCDDQRCASVPAFGPFRQMGTVPFFRPAALAKPQAGGRSSGKNSLEDALSIRLHCGCLIRQETVGWR